MPNDLDELLLARDLDTGAVEHARRLRAERSVHERLQVPDADEVVAEAAADAQVGELAHLFSRQGLPDAQVEVSFFAETLPDGERAEPTVLVVDGGHPSGDRDVDSFARRVEQLVLRRPDVRVAEMPGAFLAQHAGRLAPLVSHDHAALDFEVAVRPSESGGVQPERVVVTCHQGGGRVA